MTGAREVWYGSELVGHTVKIDNGANMAQSVNGTVRYFWYRGDAIRWLCGHSDAYAMTEAEVTS